MGTCGVTITEPGNKFTVPTVQMAISGGTGDRRVTESCRRSTFELMDK